MRPSVLLQWAGKNILIDATPDLRSQVLRARLARIDAVLLTHGHADHVLGLDDLRPFNFRQGGSIPVYGSEPTLATVRRIFDYVFREGPKESSSPKLEVRVIDGNPFALFGLTVVPIAMWHGSMPVYGFRVGNIAYLTDHNRIPEESMAKLQGLQVIFLDALRHKPHPTHSTVQQAVSIAEQLRPQRAYLTHICHDLAHARTEEQLPDFIRLSYDGLTVHGEAALSGGIRDVEDADSAASPAGDPA